MGTVGGGGRPAQAKKAFTSLLGQSIGAYYLKEMKHRPSCFLTIALTVEASYAFESSPRCPIGLECAAHLMQTLLNGAALFDLSTKLFLFFDGKPITKLVLYFCSFYARLDPFQRVGMVLGLVGLNGT